MTIWKHILSSSLKNAARCSQLVKDSHTLFGFKHFRYHRFVSVKVHFLDIYTTNIHVSRQNSSTPPNALCMVCSFLCLPHQLPTTNYYDPPGLSFSLPLQICIYSRSAAVTQEKAILSLSWFLSRDYYVLVIFCGHKQNGMQILRFTNCKNVCATSTFQLVLQSTSCLWTSRSLSVRHLLDHSQPDTTTAGT